MDISLKVLAPIFMSRILLLLGKGWGIRSLSFVKIANAHLIQLLIALSREHQARIPLLSNLVNSESLFLISMIFSLFISGMSMKGIQ